MQMLVEPPAMSLEVVRAVRTLAVELVAEYLVDFCALCPRSLEMSVHIVNLDLDTGMQVRQRARAA